MNILKSFFRDLKWVFRFILCSVGIHSPAQTRDWLGHLRTICVYCYKTLDDLDVYLDVEQRR
jgi:hypothetical protein